MAYVPHKNVPGVIGRVGTIMGEYGVNISRMVTSSGDNNVSRDSIMILGLDNDVPQEAIDRCLRDGRDLRDEDHRLLTGPSAARRETSVSQPLEQRGPEVIRMALPPEAVAAWDARAGREG